MAEVPPGDGARTATDPAGTVDAVVGHLREWDRGDGGNRTTAQRLQSFLDARLNADADSVWERDVVERGSGSAADLTVNGEIGVALVAEVGPRTVSEVRVALSLLGERYNFVVVYWLDASPASADYRRSVERGTTAARAGVEGLRFVTAPPRPPGGADGSVGGAPRVDRLATVGSVLAVGAVAVLAAVTVGWTLARTTGLGRLLLVGTAALFLLSLALGGVLAAT